MPQVRDRAAAFLDQWVAARSPGYLRGADCELHDALKLLVDAGRRGAEAAIERDGAQLIAHVDTDGPLRVVIARQ